MSSTRYRHQPMEIFQDEVYPDQLSYDHAPMPSTSSVVSKSSSPLGALTDGPSRRNIIFNPPSATSSKTSPHKSSQHNSSSPPRAPFNNRLNMISMPPPGGPVYHTDSMEKKQQIASKFKAVPQKAIFATFTNMHPAGKENYHPQAIYPGPHYGDLSASNYSLDGIYGQTSQAKRALPESALAEAPPSKKSKSDVEIKLPAPEQLPILHDDGSKPGHSYAMLIGMAILRAPNRRLTLAQIYKWISDTYSYYNASEPGWQNSIRHNLSLNKAFVKQERPKDDPGKGNYWAIEQGMEHQFFKEKTSKKAEKHSSESGPIISNSLPSATHEISQQPFKKSSTPAPQELPPSSTTFVPAELAKTILEPSSDATIPASDVFVPEDEPEDDGACAMPLQPILSSPEAAMMHSSPPVARRTRARDDTPPPVPGYLTSSRTRSHKRGFASMDDSGYFSSLNSSALRGPNNARQPTSDADRPRIKRGRAEEEIARLRGSSYESPIKGRPFKSHSVSFAPPSSSPIRRGLAYDSSQMLPPLTPAVKLLPPKRAPPSVSPNTNLRMHREMVREMVGSPDRSVNCLDENLPWSPAFHIDDGAYMFHDFGTEFDIFADCGAGLLSVAGNGSPEKRSVKRPRTDRAPHSTSVLAEISNIHQNKSITSTPMFKFTPALAPSPFESPSKPPALLSPSKLKTSATLSVPSFDLPQEDFFNEEFLTEETNEFSGMDILQGFQKIGAGGQNGRDGSKGGNMRPNFGRSFTSRF